MWSPESVAPLRIEPRFSARLAGFLLFSHGGAMAVPWRLGWPWWAVLCVVALVLASFLIHWRRHVLRRGRRALRAAVWLGDGRWRLETAGAVLERVELAPARYVHPALVVLNFCGGGNGYTLVLCADAVSAEIHRRLRARLRCHYQ